MKRLTAIDIAKAIGIILVVIGHYHPDNGPGWYEFINSLIYSFHMPLFMFASGYVYIATKRSEENYGTFIYKKIKRLMIPYFTVSILIVTLKLLTQNGMEVEHPVTPLSYLRIFYSPEAGYFLWFIWALWNIFLVMPLFKTTLSRTILFIISLLINFVPLTWLPSTFCVGQSLLMLQYFVWGALIYEHQSWIKERTKVGTSIPWIIFLGLFITNWLYPSFFANIASLKMALAYLGIYCTYLLSVKIANGWQWLSKPLLTVAASSYIIYLFHTTFEGFAKALLHKFTPILADPHQSLLFGIGAVLIIACGLIVPVLLHRYVLTRYQILQFLFGLKSSKIKTQN